MKSYYCLMRASKNSVPAGTIAFSPPRKWRETKSITDWSPVGTTANRNFRGSLITIIIVMLAVIPTTADAIGQDQREVPAVPVAADDPTTETEPQARGEELAKEEKAKEADKKDEKDKMDEKPFEEVVEDFEVIEGLFTLYRKEDEAKVLMEVRPEQLGEVFLCSITREAADGAYFDSASMLWHFPFVFKRVGKKVLFIHKNVYFRADGDTAIHRAIARGVSDSIMGSGKIAAAPHPERGSLLLEASELFIQDIAMVGPFFNENSEHFNKVKYGFDKDHSYFGALKSFSENTEIDAVLNFKSDNPKPAAALADPRSFQHVYHYSLSKLRETNYQPREADDRVGHFMTLFQDYNSVLRDTPYVRYVNRWRLEKAEPKFELAPPREPIVFWLENTVPVEYREAVTQGVLLWNKAFKRIGFKDAIVVKQQADDADWDPADVRYSTVRWIVTPGASYAVGPSRANPFTGEIYDADIRVNADMLRYVFMQYEQLSKPLAIDGPPGVALGSGPGRLGALCDFGLGAVDQAAFGWDLITARGADVDAEQYLHDFLIMLIAHEVGHTLGLRHNFKASGIRSMDQLEDAELTAEQGLTSSVMEYIPVNIAPPGRPQGQYWQTTLGPYDYWAIEYAYKPVDPDGGQSEQAMLEEIASRVAEPLLAYGTDEDAFNDARGIDPSCTRWDLGDDPIAFYQGRVGVARELWARMEGEFEKDGEHYHRMRMVFDQAIRRFGYASLNIAKYIGGIHHHRDHVGDPQGRLPFEPVAAEKQRQALAFLTEHLFGPAAFDFSPELLKKLGAERMRDFTWSIWETSRIDYPVHDVVLGIQTRTLDRLYDPIRLSRLLDLELYAGPDEQPFTMEELFTGAREAIWAELEAGSDINGFRRGLQRAHLDTLIALVLESGQGLPQDAVTLARHDLVQLGSAIAGGMDNASLTTTTQAHLRESLARINVALAAIVERRIGRSQ